VLRALDLSKTIINISIVGDAEIKKLNKKYLGKDKSTDVLSFNLDEKLPNGDFLLGEVIVNTEQAKRQAKEYGNNLEEEISDLVAHGVKHLQGLHHK